MKNNAQLQGTVTQETQLNFIDFVELFRSFQYVLINFYNSENKEK